MNGLIYKGVRIGERNEMLCLTDMWRAAGSDSSRQPAEWLRSVDAQKFIEFVREAILGNSQDEVVQVVRGGRDPSTWAHWQIAMAYAKYLLPEFHAWCNEVVRAHMERRTLVVDAPATHGDLIQSIREIVAPLAVRFDSQDVAIEQVATRVDAIAEDVGTIKLKLANATGRKRINPTVKAEHADAGKLLGGRCPHCGIARVVDENGNVSKFADYDHFYQNSKADADHTWLICKPCHSDLTFGRVPRDQAEPQFRAYQAKRRRLPGRQAKLF